LLVFLPLHALLTMHGHRNLKPVLQYLALFRSVGTFHIWVKSDKKLRDTFDLERTREFFISPQRPIISWLCARPANESHALAFCSRSDAVSVFHYSRTRHFLCLNMFYDHILAEIWMLPDMYI